MFLSEVHCANGSGVEDGTTLPSHLWGRVLESLAVQEVLTEKQTISSPVSQAFIRSLPSNYDQAILMSGTTVLLCFISGW